MWFIKCVVCNDSILGYDLEEEGWAKVDNAFAINVGSPSRGAVYACDKHKPSASVEKPPQPEQVVVVDSIIVEPELDPLQEKYGFSEPEDGSSDRYVNRRRKTPWAKHTGWWLVHNVCAHVLIGFFPVEPFFKFHDWTSRKMHSK